jgi:aquaglyceroporin related protein, other eukaryote
MTNISAFFSEFLAAATFVLMVLAVTDKRNASPPGMLPVAVFVIYLGIGAALGMETGYAINPARDFGPRLMTSMVGYGKEGK